MKIDAFHNEYGPFIKDTTLTWFQSDTKEHYKSTGNYYSENDIDYKLNKFGFRCDDFDTASEKRILFLGCSKTVGIGLPLESTWPYKLLQLIRKETNYNIPFWNIAQSGSGLDRQIRYYYHYGIKLKPHIVFAYFPEYRRELYTTNSTQPLLHLPSNFDLNFDKFPYLIDYRIMQYETEKNMCFLDCMLKLNQTKMIWNTWSTVEYDAYKEIQTRHNFILTNDAKARDRLHPGEQSNLSFAEEIYNKYKNIIIEQLNGAE